MTSPTSCQVSSIFLATLLVVSTLLLVTACSGDEKPASPNAEPSPAPTTEVTEPGAGRISVSPPRPLALTPLAKTPEVWPIGRNIWGVLVYDSATGEVTVAAEAGGGAFWASWLSETELLVRIDNSAAIYDIPSRSYRTLELGFDLLPNSSAVVSPDRAQVAIGGDEGDLVLVDLPAMTYKVLSSPVLPLVWSPDSGRLLVRGSEGIHSVIDLAEPARLVELPENANYSGWQTDSRVIGRTQIKPGGPTQAVVVDVTGPLVPVVLFEALDGGRFSPDGRYAAVSRAQRANPADLNSLTSHTTVYRLESLEVIAELDSITICCWLGDSTRFLALRNLCKDGESLVIVNIHDGKETLLARAGTSQVGISPDDRWVAFAHSTPGLAALSIVPTDGSAAPHPAIEIPGAPVAASDPEWSPDGRFLAFSLGGYDRCN